MQIQPGFLTRAVLRSLHMLGCKNGPSFDLFDYDHAEANPPLPQNSDAGATHLGFYVEDIGRRSPI
jgi:glyoxylase I family protein